MCSEGSRKASGGLLRELAALGGSGYADDWAAAAAVFLKGILGRLRGVPLSVLERFLTASEIADAGGAELSVCSDVVVSDRLGATGELGMERED